MLYKKYHKNFVRQFKKGARIKTYSNSTISSVRIVLGFNDSIITEEPYRIGNEICVKSNSPSDYSFTTIVVSYTGKLAVNIYVVQEIS